MSNEERKLENKIRLFEDMLLRNRRDPYQVQKINAELTKMRLSLAKMRYRRYES